MRTALLIRLFAFLLLGNSLLGLQAQERVFLRQVPEYLAAQFDKSFYVAGEDLWYGIHFLEPANRVSGIVHVELVAPNGDYVFRQSLKAESALVSGDMALPATLKTGYYLFRAYTNWNLNFQPQTIYEKAIPIYSLGIDASGAPAVLPKTIPLAQEGPIRAKAENIQVNPRESVRILLTPQSQRRLKGQFSVSVVAAEFAGAQEGRNGLEQAIEAYDEQSKPEFIRGEDPINPEARYERTLIVKDPNSGDNVSSNFIVAFVRNTRQKILANAKNGVISLGFDDFYDSSMVQIFDASPFKPAYIPQITLVAETYPVSEPNPIADKPPVTDEVKVYIRDYKRRFQLNQVFGSQSYLRAARSAQMTPAAEPSLVYRTEDFIVMPDMETFVKQAVPPLNVRERKKKEKDTPEVSGLDTYPKTFSLFIPHKDFETKGIVKERPPLMMVNNYFTYDTKEVFSMKWSEVSALEIFNNNLDLPFQFGPIGNFGVIHYRTRDGETPDEILNAANNLVVPGFYLPRTFSAELGETGASKIPNFQPMMYWSSEGQLTDDNAEGGIVGSIDFPAGDKPGTYLVQVSGVLEDGTPVYLETNFTVQVSR